MAGEGGISHNRVVNDRGHYKDAVLDRLARLGNVAQFVSFDPSLRQRFAWIQGFEPNAPFDGLEAAVDAILRRSTEASVNIRTFEPYHAKSRDFVYGLRDAAEVGERLRGFASAGLHTIVNETVDIHDGGVSGVAFGELIEFAPDDTPRCVEKPGTVALSRALAMKVFRTVYGFEPQLSNDPSTRIEFSIHPLRRGYRHQHSIVWEVESESNAPAEAPAPRWPNRFSQFIGDKAFGLLIGALLGFDVPYTMVVPRRLAPFSFGSGGLAEPWIRTAPTEQVPGRFTTNHGWLDPYKLMHEEDPEGTRIASVLCQRGIDAKASGAAVAQADGSVAVEGVHGFGDRFMVGERRPETLPDTIVGRVLDTYRRLAEHLGPVRFEWVDDGTTVWIVQLHAGASVSAGRVIVPGAPVREHRFDVAHGLESLRALVERVQGTDEGIVLVGFVGITSHFGDILRRAGVPSRLEAPSSSS